MNSLKKIVFPVAAIVLATGSAFATNISKKAKAVNEQGHIYRPNEVVACQPTSKWCDNAGAFVCTIDVGMGEENLYGLQGTSCPTILTNSTPVNK